MGQIGSSKINAVLACRQPFLFVPVVVGELSPSLCVANALVANCSIHWKSNIGQRISACAYVSMVTSTLLTGHRGPGALLGVVALCLQLPVWIALGHFVCDDSFTVL